MDKVFTLPDAEEITKRLKSLDMGANDYMAERFYPLIAQEAGCKLVAQGIVMMLTLKIYDFTASGYPPAMANILHMYIPKIIDVLVDDKEVADAAKAFHQQAMGASRNG